MSPIGLSSRLLNIKHLILYWRIIVFQGLRESNGLTVAVLTASTGLTLGPSSVRR